MGLTAASFENTSTNFTNVEFEVEDGWLEITPVEATVTVTITGHNATQTYNGSEYTVTGFNATISNDKYTTNDFTYTGAATVKGTNAQDAAYPMGLKAEDFTNTNTNFTNVEFVVTDGWLKIEPAEIEITADSDEKVYNGTALTKNSYTITKGEFCGTDGFKSVSVTGSQTDVGTAENVITGYELADGVLAGNYKITTVKGELEVTPVTDKVVVKITGKTDTREYNGQKQTVEGYTVKIDNSLYKETDFTFSGTAKAEGTEPQDEAYPMGLTAADFTNNSKNFTNVVFEVTDGWLKITPVQAEVTVEIVGNTDEVEFDGLEHTVEGYTVVSISNELYTSADFRYNGEAIARGTQPGTYKMVLDAAEFKNVSKRFDNVRFVATNGWLKITDEPTHNIEIALTKTIRQTGNAEPQPTAFTFRVEATDADGKVIYTKDITSEKLAKGDNDVALNWKVLNRDLVNILQNASKLTLSEVDKGEAGWTYDKTVYELTLRPKATAYALTEVEPKTKYEVVAMVNGEVLTPSFVNEYSYNPIYVPPETTTPLLNTSDHVAYVIGYPDGGVHPNATITRAEVATIFFRMLNEDVRDANYTKENSFTDVPADKWYSAAISTMAKLKIVTGDPDGSFRPNDCITRAEFAAIAARFDESAASSVASFSDISGHWAARYISRAAELGWIKGYSDNTFRPNKDITRAEAMAMINRVLNRNPESVDDLLPDMNVWNDNLDTSKWYYLDVQEATNSHDYFRKYGGNESWVQMIADPDWKALER